MIEKISNENKKKIDELKFRKEKYFDQRTEIWVEISALSDVEATASQYARLKKDNYILENLILSILLILVLKGILNVDVKAGLLISSGLSFVSWGVCNLERHRKMKKIQLNNPTVDFECFDFVESYSKRLALHSKTEEIDRLIINCNREIDKLKNPIFETVSFKEKGICDKCNQDVVQVGDKGHVKKLGIRRG